MMHYIPYAHQSISNDDIDEVIKILRSDWLTTGPAIEEFEKSVAAYCGARYAVAVTSATAALHIACLSANLNKGDILWTAPNTFVASANCALYCGAEVDFVDIDVKTYDMSVEALEHKLVVAERAGKLPKIVVPVHFSGQSCEMDKIKSLSDKYGFYVIEDASHAIGGQYKKEPIGSCKYSDMAVFSFHPVKIITTGEGGMVLTNNKKLYERLIQFRSHGITRQPEFMQGSSDGPWYYQQIELGYNYRMTDIQATLGKSQLKRINEFISRRNVLAKRYNQTLSHLPITLPYQFPDADSSWHLYVVKINSTQSSKSRLQVFNEMQQQNIGVNVHYMPVHLQPYYRGLGFKTGDFPIAEQYYQDVISLPMYYSLTDEEQDYVVTALTKILK